MTRPQWFLLIWLSVGAAYEILAALSQQLGFIPRMPTMTETVRRGIRGWSRPAKWALFCAICGTGAFLAGHFVLGWL